MTTTNPPDQPAVDVLTDRAAVVLQERPVVPLSRWLADAVAVAARGTRSVQVVTPPTSRLTTPLESALLAAGGRWVVRSAGGYFDGLRGEVLTWSGSAFEPNGEVRSDFAEARPVTGGVVRVQLTVVHPAGEDTELGGVVEECYRALTGGPPAGWGVAEPASERWVRRGLTEYCRRRAPEPSTLVVVGGADGTPAVGTLAVSRRPSGVVERLDLSVGQRGAPDYPALDRLAERLAELSGPLLRTMLVSLVPGRPDCTVEPRPSAPVPYGVLIGPEGVGERGADAARTAPAPYVLLCGPPLRPSCWCRLVGDGPDGAEPALALQQVLVHFGLPTGAVDPQ